MISYVMLLMSPRMLDKGRVGLVGIKIIIIYR